jgi:Fibronectin type III domain
MYTVREDGAQAPCGATFRRARQSGAQGPAPAVQNRRARFSFILLLAFFSLLLSACPLYNPAAFIKGQPAPGGQPQAGADDISSTATQATLQWDPPATGGSQVVSYTISYRIHGTTTWTTLATIPATSQPEYTVLRSTLGSGSFDFAVVAVNGTGAISPLHTSLDATADPTSGWYLTWGQ